MKYILLLILSLSGCSGFVDAESVVNSKVLQQNHNADAMTENCIKLGECLHAKVKLTFFRNQNHSPYACSVTVDKDRQIFLYPDAMLDFGELGFRAYENAIAVCELATKTGQFSDKAVAAHKATWIAHEKALAERQRAKEEAAQAKIEKATIEMEVR